MIAHSKPVIRSSGLSKIGSSRKKNEDFWGELPKYNFYALADGMGGHKSGEIASKEAVHSLLEIINDSMSSYAEKIHREDAKIFLRSVIRQVNEEIHQKSLENEKTRGMGTTLCCIHFMKEPFVVYAHVGDSRIYRLRNKELEQLTEDHSILSEIVGLGDLDSEEQEGCSFKHLITKAIGLYDTVDPEAECSEREQDDIYIMCSDGLSDHVSKMEIQEIINLSESLEEAAKILIETAKCKGGQDDITVVLMKVEENN